VYKNQYDYNTILINISYAHFLSLIVTSSTKCEIPCQSTYFKSYLTGGLTVCTEHITIPVFNVYSMFIFETVLHRHKLSISCLIRSPTVYSVLILMYNAFGIATDSVLHMQNDTNTSLLLMH